LGIIDGLILLYFDGAALGWAVFKQTGGGSKSTGGLALLPNGWIPAPEIDWHGTIACVRVAYTAAA